MMPTTPLRVIAAAGFTAGSMPIVSQPGKVSRRCLSAAAEAVLQATTTALQPASSRNRAIPSLNARMSFCVQGPYGTCAWSAT